MDIREIRTWLPPHVLSNPLLLLWPEGCLRNWTGEGDGGLYLMVVARLELEGYNNTKKRAMELQALSEYNTQSGRNLNLL